MRHRQIIRLIAASLLARTALASAQITPGEFDELNTAIGQRVETTVILGTANSVNTGAYKWNLNNADVNITRATWEFDFGGMHPIGDTGLKYIWNSDGGAGYARYTNQYITGPLIGNEEDFQTYALGENLGPRVFLTSDISLMPEVGLIYGYTNNEFKGPTKAAVDVIDTTLVNWHVQTLSVTPSIQAQYERTFFYSLRVLVRGNFAYYTTFPIEKSTDDWSFRSDSEVWQNYVDLDYKTGLKLLTSDMHLGGTFSRTDLFGGVKASTGVSNFYNIGGRITFDTKLPIVSMLGLGASYTWGTGFHGYTYGIIFGVSF